MNILFKKQDRNFWDEYIIQSRSKNYRNISSLVQTNDKETTESL